MFLKSWCVYNWYWHKIYLEALLSLILLLLLEVLGIEARASHTEGCSLPLSSLCAFFLWEQL